VPVGSVSGSTGKPFGTERSRPSLSLRAELGHPRP
jgi:hypothetical protein